MKNNLLLFLGFLFTAATVSGQAQRFAISTNLFNIILSGPSLAVSYHKSQRLSFQLYGAYGRFGYFSDEDPRYEFKTGILDLRYTVIKHVYLASYLRYIDKFVRRDGYVDRTGFFSVSERDFHGKGISGGLLFGLNLADLSKRVNLEAFAGGGVGKFISQRDYANNEPTDLFLDARLGLLLGLKF
jgi:hypothetical protein